MFGGCGCPSRASPQRLQPHPNIHMVQTNRLYRRGQSDLTERQMHCPHCSRAGYFSLERTTFSCFCLQNLCLTLSVRKKVDRARIPLSHALTLDYLGGDHWYLIQDPSCLLPQPNPSHQRFTPSPAQPCAREHAKAELVHPKNEKCTLCSSTTSRCFLAPQFASSLFFWGGRQSVLFDLPSRSFFPCESSCVPHWDVLMSGLSSGENDMTRV